MQRPQHRTGMTRYTPASAAAELSTALWNLACPDTSGQGTQYLFATVTATDESLWLVVDDDYSIPVHPAAELGAIAGILQPFIDNGSLPVDTLDNLNALIDANRGKRLVVWDAFPQLFKDLSKTRQEMIDAGLLAETPI